MKQIIQSLKNGNVEVASLPIPTAKSGQLLIETSCTLVSAGTERSLVEFGKAGWINKARQQPEKVRMVMDKIKTDGLVPTIEAVFDKLNQPLPMGYCNVGRITSVGSGEMAYSVGDRVISNGKHAEVVSVPKNLCAKIPDNVGDEAAAFTVLGAIALQGIRLVKPTLGETVVVTGLGLVGLLTVQLLRANGCRVLGLDFDKEKLELASQFGAEVVDLSVGQDPVDSAEKYSRGRGADAVIITASTKSSEPLHQSASMCRKRGRIVLVGVAGLKMSRDDFFKKELTFQVSASYGPGRYDPNYEEKGQDYPFGFVRWTEQRNFEAVLDMMAEGRLDVDPLISHRFSIYEAEKAYELVGGGGPSLGILLTYPGIEITEANQTVLLRNNDRLTNVKNSGDARKKDSKSDSLGDGFSGRKARVSFLGAGNYATAILIPAFKATGVELQSVASSGGVTGLHAGRKYGFAETTTASNRLFEDSMTDAVVITTRHNSHAKFVVQALEAGKHVFVEKPLCLTLEELDEIQSAYRPDKLLMVGFNRRFAPLVIKVKELLKSVVGPKAMVMTVNAGAIPSDHWTQDVEVGGGRIIGEACHFIDLLRYLASSPIVGWGRYGMNSATRDTETLNLQFADGSVATVHYFSNGPKSYPKERLEVFVAGRALTLDNYRSLTGFGWPNFKKASSWRQNKGQKACVKAFVSALNGESCSPIPITELLEVSRVAVEISQ